MQRQKKSTCIQVHMWGIFKRERKQDNQRSIDELITRTKNSIEKFIITSLSHDISQISNELTLKW